MKINKEELKEIVRRVLTYYIYRRDHPENEKKTLFLIPLFPAGLHEILLEYEMYGKMEGTDFVLEEDIPGIPELADANVYCMENREDIKHIFLSLMHYQKLEIYSPSLDFLREVQAGREENLFVKITLYFLFMGRPVTVRLPYQPGCLPEGRFGKAVRELQADLWDMGISFADIHSGVSNAINAEMGQDKELITEEAVEKIFKEGFREIMVSKGTVITPLGMERAKELGIHVVKR